MKKLIVIAISIVLLASIAGHAKTEEVSDADKLLAELLERPEFSFGELETFDLDNDGSEDKFVYTFEREEVAEDLFLDRSVEYERTHAGFMGTLILEFANTGDETKTYSHVEIIPKSFAESVDDLEFSVPPDEIINPDAELGWRAELIEKSINRIVVRAKKTAEEVAVGKSVEEGFVGGLLAGVEEIGKKLNGEKCDFNKVVQGAKEAGTKAGMEVGVEAAIGAVLNSLNDFAFINALNKCRQPRGPDRDPYLLDMVREFLGKVPPEYLDTIIIHIYDPLYRKIARAYVYGFEHCDKLDGLEADLCKAYLIEGYCKSDYAKDTEGIDRCISSRAIQRGSLLACSAIKNEDQRNYCYARVAGDKKYCEKIKDEELRKDCLEALGEAPEEEEEEEWPFTDEDCATFKSAFQSVLLGFELVSSCGRYLASFTAERYYNTYLDLDGRNVPQEYRCQVMLDITGLGAAYAREHFEARRNNICGPEQEAEMKAVYKAEGECIIERGDNDFLLYYPVPSLSGVYMDGRKASRNTPVGYCTELMVLHGNYTIEVHCLLAPSKEASLDMADSVLETAKSWLG